MDTYIEVRTIENTTVLIRKDQISAIEQIPTTSRTEGYLKLYVAGYSFGVKMEKEDFIELLKENK